MTAWILALLAALAGASVAAYSGSTRGWLVATVGAAIAFEIVAVRGRIEGEVEAEAVRAWRRVELLAIPLLVAGLQLVSGSGISLGAEFAVAVVFGGGVWSLVNATLIDLDAIERAIDDTDGMSPLQRIRLRLVATGMLAVGCAALGAVGLDGVLDLARPATPTLSYAPLGFWIVGLLALGATARLVESRRWARDGAAVDPVVGGRWAKAVVVTVAALGSLAVVVASLPSGVTALPVQGLLRTGRFGAWLSERTAGMREALDGAGSVEDLPPVGVPTPPSPVAIDPGGASWVGDVALWGFVALIFAFAVVAGRRRRERREHPEGPGLRDVLGRVLQAVVDLLAGMWSAIRRLLQGGRRDSVESAGATRSDGIERRSRWNPRDSVRRRIATAYWRSVGVVSVSESPPRLPETPREYAHRVDDDRFHRVTALFEEARYSDHLLDTDSATSAESAAEELDS